ncbi:ABC transporter permease [Arthrobacter crystallopoietes]|jgi:ABC-type nitrate/sulfonate/bicarbonate transport system permease component|uniref:ABC-type nitrate/sulfonate/bicarbonate transport system, permease component n=1 Tax=Crystallibacter crystallopoietes TaxID=37928 RepID=A0A1H1AIW1_9MICC|nr:ABC transporter permease subunit [Arthrobacter crystallopoietes]AUI51509.1 ABC transporter permease [Arthrobacter crystallopoietes]SDQ39713.1 ABC-type nitrate/sulfonate/bicarbonate transport system, permease component [Arthrobacter crystallopoietes]
MSNATHTLSAPARSARRRPGTGLSRRWLGAGTVVVLFLLWELASATGVLPAASLPPASDVIVAFGAQLFAAGFWLALWDTLSMALLGLVLIVLIAAPIALVIGLSHWWQESTWFVLEFLKPIPPVALIPLGLLLWGPTPGMKLFLIVFGAIWPLLTQLVYGFKEVNGVARDMAKSYRLGWWLTTSRLVFPSVLPFATTGLRISAAIAVVIAVVTEMIGGAAGLGQNIVVAQSANALAEMYALIIAAGLLGLGINLMFRFGEKPLLFWHPSIREAGKL